MGAVLGVTGASVSEQARSRASVDALARAAGEMLCGYLQRVAQGKA